MLMIHSHTRVGSAIMRKCLENELSMLERQIPQDEALYKSRLLRAEML